VTSIQIFRTICDAVSSTACNILSAVHSLLVIQNSVKIKARKKNRHRQSLTESSASMLRPMQHALKHQCTAFVFCNRRLQAIDLLQRVPGANSRQYTLALLVCDELRREGLQAGLRTFHSARILCQGRLDWLIKLQRFAFRGYAVYQRWTPGWKGVASVIALVRERMDNLYCATTVHSTCATRASLSSFTRLTCTSTFTTRPVRSHSALSLTERFHSARTTVRHCKVRFAAL
jgi:hypothetical protein